MNSPYREADIQESGPRFKRGDIVKLLSGGAPIVVCHVGHMQEYYVDGYYSDRNGEIRKATYLPEFCLVMCRELS